MGRQLFTPLLLVAIGAWVILAAACAKVETYNNDNYYVKYEVTSSADSPTNTLTVNVMSGENLQRQIHTINATTSWAHTVGPVKEPFYADIVVQANEPNKGQLRMQTRISVSKNGSPFEVKQSDNDTTPRINAVLSYLVND